MPQACLGGGLSSAVKRLCFIGLTALVLVGGAAAATVPDARDSVWYDSHGKEVAVPASYRFDKAAPIQGTDGKAASSPKDMFIHEKGIYVLDSENDRVILLNTADYSVKKVISGFHDKTGTAYSLIGPDDMAAQGIFVSEEGKLFLADTGNGRVLVCDDTGLVTQALSRPDNMQGMGSEIEYRPIKVSADSAGRIYVIAQNINMGLIMLDADGQFITYLGAPPVVPDFFTLFWRRFSTKQQLENMEQFVPTEYSNLAIGENDFIYGTISAIPEADLYQAVQTKDKSGTTSPIRKLNPGGRDVLRRLGVYAPLGNLNKPSSMVDVALGGNGVYSLLDASGGHVFTYNDDGELLFVFGSKGDGAGQFVSPVAVGYAGDSLLVLDAELSSILAFDLTAYGQELLHAVGLTYTGEFDAAYQSWETIAHKNPAFTLSYVGVGKARMQAGQYEEAMDYFQKADDKDNYTLAFELRRKEIMKSGFGICIIGLAVVLFSLFIVTLIRRLIRYAKGAE